MDLSERGAADAPRHPWEIARAAFFVGVLAREGCLERTTWLDVGAGDAWFSRQLLGAGSPQHRVVAWDSFFTPDELAAPTPDPRLRLVADQPDERFEGILLMDVVEHVADDRGFLRGVVEQNLAPGGVVLVTVPAYQRLFSAHDVALRHYRRYHPSECRALLVATGLRIERQGGLFHSLLVARAASVAIERARTKLQPSRRQARGGHGIGAWSGGERLGRAIVRGLGYEVRLSRALSRRGHTVPGLTYWALCTAAA